MIPLPVLFAAPERDQVRISPGGRYLAWRARDAETGSLNLWVQPRPTASPAAATTATNPNHANASLPRQVTFAKDRDACVMFWFSADDRTLLFLREPTLGSELYHLYAVDIDHHDDAEVQEEHNHTSFSKPRQPRQPRDLIANPKTTCAMGFCGGLQVWIDPHDPRHVYVSTSVGGGIRSLFWNVCKINIDSGEDEVVAWNPLSTWWGLLTFVLASAWHYLFHQCLKRGASKNPPRATVQWFPDAQFRFRGRLQIGMTDLSTAWQIQRDSKQQDEWTTIHQVPWEQANMSLVGSMGGSGTAHFDFCNGNDNQQEFVDVHVCAMGDTTSWERFDMATGRHVRTIASHLQSDITGFVLHPQTRHVQAVQFNYERPTLQSITADDPHDNDIADDLKFLQTDFFQGTNVAVSIVSRTVRDDLWVVHVQSDQGLPACGNCPSGYFLYRRQFQQQRLQQLVLPNTPPRQTNNDASSTNGAVASSMEFLVSPHPGLADYYPLAPMRPVHIPARDGEDLLCYISQPPPSVAATSNRDALVVLIHGGPQHRDFWQYHALCQLLCHRGMQVLQVNYRGSTGMGTRFMKLGMVRGAFATRVQEDIYDAAQFAVDQNWVSRDRLAVMGGSFGGYSTLMAMIGSASTAVPEKPKIEYQCGVAICPPSIMGAANPHKSFHGNPVVAQYWKQVFGSAVANDKAASRAVSPMFHTKAVKRPILLMHGQEDPRVPIVQSDELAEQLRRNTAVGGLCEYVTFASEGHGIKNEPNVLYMYHRVERFLCKHLQLPEPPQLEDKWIKGHTATSTLLEPPSAPLDKMITKEKKV